MDRIGVKRFAMTKLASTAQMPMRVAMNTIAAPYSAVLIVLAELTAAVLKTKIAALMRA